jgi:hypothetical protein
MTQRPDPSEFVDAIDIAVDRPIYLLRLRPEPGVNGTRALRHALKTLLRCYRLRAVDLREERQP